MRPNRTAREAHRTPTPRISSYSLRRRALRQPSQIDSRKVPRSWRRSRSQLGCNLPIDIGAKSGRVDCGIHFLSATLGSAKHLGGLVVFADVFQGLLLQIGCGGEHAAYDHVTLDLREPQFFLVEPSLRVLQCVEPSLGLRFTVQFRIFDSTFGVSLDAGWPAWRLNRPDKRPSANRFAQRLM